MSTVIFALPCILQCDQRTAKVELLGQIFLNEGRNKERKVTVARSEPPNIVHVSDWDCSL